ncbi:MAG: sensor of ECF-type sigma factor [Winogradskyella sp.]|nr:MAG: sensor of ECF-type sigma factor [Winogradskyella sp.]
MKNLITLTVLFVSFLSFAQPPRDGKMREKIKAQKIAFITEKLNLTADEAQKFWPIYNEFEATTEKIKSEDLRPVKQQMRRNSDISDKEANKLLDKLIRAENRMHNAKIKLVNDLKTVLPAKKIIMLKAVEDQFNKRLLEQLKKFRERRKKN